MNCSKFCRAVLGFVAGIVAIPIMVVFIQIFEDAADVSAAAT